MSDTVTKSMNADEKFDIIIIGSGMGALALASLMARLHDKRILMLERHFKMGGFTHTFKRKGKYLWDVGLHYVGGMKQGSINRELFDAITDAKVIWNKMPDIFERFVYPDFTFDVKSDKIQFMEDLISQFPKEKSAIQDYFKDVVSISSWFARHVTMKAMPPVLGKVASLLTLKGRGSALMTTGQYMNENFKDEKLRAVLLSQWGDYGLPPSRSAFVIHALVAGHYFEGGYYPVGGSGTIADSVKTIMEGKGGHILLNHCAEEIIIEKNRAIGVRAKEIIGKKVTEKEFFAPIIVSNTGAYNTYLKLLPENYSQSFKNEIINSVTSTSNLTLYLGFNGNPETLGFHGENYWIYDSYDHDDIYLRRNSILSGQVPAAYLSFPSLKDPEAKAHTAEVIGFCDYEPFNKWKDQKWQKREADYQALKDGISESLIGFMDARFKGFRDLIDYQELSTPLTNEHFTDHINGNIYGLPCTPERFNYEWLGPHTPVENLYLTGADASSPGIIGAMMGGFATAASILGLRGLLSLIKELRRRKNLGGS